MQKNITPRPKKVNNLDSFFARTTAKAVKPTKVQTSQISVPKKIDSEIEEPKSAQTTPIIATFDSMSQLTSSASSNVFDSATSSPKTELSTSNWDNDSILAQGTPGLDHPSILTPKNTVIIPDWQETEKIPADTGNEHVRMTPEEQIELHYSIEVIEHRIQQGDDKIHDHPGQSISVFLRNGVGVLSEEEKLLRQGYEFKKPEIIVPSFWTPRVWDAQSISLTPEESQKLLDDGFKHVKRCRKHYVKNSKEEEDFQPSDSDDFEPEVPVRTLPTRRRTTMATRSSGRVPTLPEGTTLLCISTKYYDTDISEDETEPEDF